MPTSVVIALIQIIPSVLWVALTISVILAFHRELLPRISGFNIFGIQAEFVREELDRAIEKRAVEVSENDRERALRRFLRLRDVFRGARVLWLDEKCEHEASELTVLRSSGVMIELVCSIKDAGRKLAEARFDAVVCVQSTCSPVTGTALLAEMRARGVDRPVILYFACGDSPEQGTPGDASAVAARPDELLHCLSDTLERARI